MRSRPLNHVMRDWTTLAKEDPLWSILSRPGKDGGRWTVPEFLRTGVEDVARYRVFLARLGAPARFSHVLDFGCGVGRMSRAWADFADRVTGLDIADPMVTLGRSMHRDRPEVVLMHNPHGDLRQIPDHSCDLVFSHICLQHMPFSLASGYIREFARVARPGGWIAFQLPQPPSRSQAFARIRRWIVGHLPFGLGVRYRRWKYGRSVLFDMHFTPKERVLELAAALGLETRGVVPEAEAGELEGTLYFFRRP